MEYHQCRGCDKKYEEMKHFKKSHKMDHYVKAHLGYCGETCFGKLTKRQKARENMLCYVYGTVRKDNHYKL